jgi:hypothetical protein
MGFRKLNLHLPAEASAQAGPFLSSLLEIKRRGLEYEIL